MASGEVRWSISDVFDGFPNLAHPLTYLGAAGAQERELDMAYDAPHAGVALGWLNTRCSGHGCSAKGTHHPARSGAIIEMESHRSRRWR